VTTEISPPDLPRNPTLEDAWQCFAKYDKNAVSAQKRFIFQQKLILALGVIATTLAVVYSVLENLPESSAPVWFQPLLNQYTLNVIHGLVVVAPIILSVLIAGSVKFNMGVSWVMLRSSAEALKKEIFRYRMGVGEYNPTTEELMRLRDVQLARKVKTISKRLMETQVNQTGLEPYKGTLPPLYGTAQGDDGFSSLTADQYVTYRVEDQFNYYQKKALKLSRELQHFQWLVYILGGIGTLLAAFGFDVWIAVSSALATALASFLEFKRVETNLIACNTAASDLYDIRTWWRALSEIAKNDSLTIDTLVSSSEAVIQSENAGWVQEMRDALSEIYGEKKESEAVQALLTLGGSSDVLESPGIEAFDEPEATDKSPALSSDAALVEESANDLTSSDALSSDLSLKTASTDTTLTDVSVNEQLANEQLTNEPEQPVELSSVNSNDRLSDNGDEIANQDTKPSEATSEDLTV
jgi:hypothetical protein